jgi:hypothetical protein
MLTCPEGCGLINSSYEIFIFTEYNPTRYQVKIRLPHRRQT